MEEQPGKSRKGRLILSGAHDAVYNMACDEALGLCSDLPVLRFYTWKPPAVSLGYFQDMVNVQDKIDVLGNVCVVRRMTGGGAIYHDRELTYAVIARPGLLPLPGGTADSYRFLHRPFVVVLNRLGIDARDSIAGTKQDTPVCFHVITDFDVSVNGRKILGSAQRRRREFFLQHGSLQLERNPFAPEATSVYEELGQDIDPDDLTRQLAQAVSEHLGIDFVPSELTAAEERMMVDLIPKYAGSKA